MNDCKWTTGPWMVVGTSAKTWIKSEITPDDGGDIICEAPDCWGDSMRRWQANARLIAAAPDLYNALDQAVTSMLDSGYSKESVVVRECLRVIAKARVEEE